MVRVLMTGAKRRIMSCRYSSPKPASHHRRGEQRAIQIRPSNELSGTLMCQMLAHVPCPCTRARARYLCKNSSTLGAGRAQRASRLMAAVLNARPGGSADLVVAS